MYSAVSLEYLQSLYNEPNGIPQLDDKGKLNESVLPADAIHPYRGVFSTSSTLIANQPTGQQAWYAWVTDTSSYWYWNTGQTTPGWVNSQITDTAYLALSSAAKAASPWTIIPATT